MDGIVIMYGWVRETREVLLKHCEMLGSELLTAKLDNFGFGSIRNLLVHVAECYQWWLDGFPFQRDFANMPHEDYPDIYSIRAAYREVDVIFDRFVKYYDGKLDEPISGMVRWQGEPLVVTPRWLLTHAITHEFHHKGQIVSMSRHLERPAPDTDLVLPTFETQAEAPAPKGSD
jgi:uncharacterized damage-inducible protein DinB